MKKPVRKYIGYIFFLLLYVYSFWIVSFQVLYLSIDGNPLYAYIGNILLMMYVLLEDRLTEKAYEAMYKRMKKEGFLKKHMRKRLANIRWRPTMKMALYLFYIICLLLGRILYLGESFLPADSDFIQASKGYFSEMYYALILLLAADKLKEYFIKERKYRNSYYSQYDDENNNDESDSSTNDELSSANMKRSK